MKKLMKKALTVAAVFCILCIGTNTFAEYEKESAIFSIDFDESDSTPEFQWTNDNNSVKDASVVPVNGEAELTRTAFSGRGPVLKLKTPINVSNNTNLFVEMRFRQNLSKTLSADKPLLKWTGSTANYFAAVYCYEGKLCYGKGNGDSAKKTSLNTDYEILGNEWYTLRMHIYNKEKQMSVEIIPDDSELPVYDENYAIEHGYDFKQPLMWYNLDTLSQLNLPYTGDLGNTNLDYIHVWDEDFKVTKTQFADKSENIPADTDFSVTFSNIPKESSLKNITVKDSKNNSIPYEVSIDGKTANLYFLTGLKYNEDYIVNIPSTVVDENNEAVREKNISFKTELPVLYIGMVNSHITQGKASTSVFISNNGVTDKEYSILNVLYDDSGKVVKMTNERFKIKAGEEATLESKTESDGAVTVKGYLWDGISL